jgi:hypothetical protein
VVGAVHDELGAGGDCAEFPDDQLVADERIVVQDVLLEIGEDIGVVVVGELSDFDIGSSDQILDETHPGVPRHGVGFAGIWAIHARNLSVESRFAFEDRLAFGVNTLRKIRCRSESPLSGGAEKRPPIGRGNGLGPKGFRQISSFAPLSQPRFAQLANSDYFKVSQIFLDTTNENKYWLW